MKAFSITALCMLIVLTIMLGCVTTRVHKKDEYIVWSQANLNRYSLRMSINHNNRWLTPEDIENSDKPIIVPTLSVKHDGDTYVAWTELNGVKGRIRYKIKRDGVWENSQELKTATSSDMAPAIAIDAHGNPWMVWSGTGKTGDDIYFSRWTGNQWQPPKRVNSNDEWPDVLPSITVDSQKRIIVTWQGYNGERYLKYSCYWTGKNWSQESVVGEIPLETVSSNQDLPEFIPEGSQGSLYFGDYRQTRKFIKTTPFDKSNGG